MGLSPDHHLIIYPGSPIWYGKAPRLMLTFLDTYKFTGKTLIPFITSGSSGIGAVQNEYESLAAPCPMLKL